LLSAKTFGFILYHFDEVKNKNKINVNFLSKMTQQHHRLKARDKNRGATNNTSLKQIKPD